MEKNPQVDINPTHTEFNVPGTTWNTLSVTYSSKLNFLSFYTWTTLLTNYPEFFYVGGVANMARTHMKMLKKGEGV